jgi:hypothetical protein
MDGKQEGVENLRSGCHTLDINRSVDAQPVIGDLDPRTTVAGIQRVLCGVTGREGERHLVIGPTLVLEATLVTLRRIQSVTF